MEIQVADVYIDDPVAEEDVVTVAMWREKFSELAELRKIIDDSKVNEELIPGKTENARKEMKAIRKQMRKKLDWMSLIGHVDAGLLASTLATDNCRPCSSTTKMADGSYINWKDVFMRLAELRKIIDDSKVNEQLIPGKNEKVRKEMEVLQRLVNWRSAIETEMKPGSHGTHGTHGTHEPPPPPWTPRQFYMKRRPRMSCCSGRPGSEPTRKPGSSKRNRRKRKRSKRKRRKLNTTRTRKRTRKSTRKRTRKSTLKR